MAVEVTKCWRARGAGGAHCSLCGHSGVLRKCEERARAALLRARLPTGAV